MKNWRVLIIVAAALVGLMLGGCDTGLANCGTDGGHLVGLCQGLR